MPDQPFQLFDSFLILVDRGLLGEDLRPFRDELFFPMLDRDRKNAIRTRNLADGLGPA